MVEKHQFAAIPVAVNNGVEQPLGAERSEKLWIFLQEKGYLDSKERVQDLLRTALKEGSLELPPEFEPQREAIIAILKKAAGRLEVKNADERRQIRVRKEIFLSEDFKALWDRIKHKTTYRVEFDNEKLIADCVRAIQDAPQITRTRLQWRKADIAIGKAGVEAEEKGGAATITLHEMDIELPDLLTELQDRTQLTRRTLLRIVQESGRLGDFKQNPQAFLDLAAEVINKAKQLALVDGVQYRRIGEYYAQELFEQEELSGYLKNLLEKTNKSVYEQVMYDSKVEREFAEQMEKQEEVRLYAKLPTWFKIPTPLGNYTPDWAVLVDTNEGERLYFVIENKGAVHVKDLRHKEEAKIVCGKKHFKAIAGSGAGSVQYVLAKEWSDVPIKSLKEDG